MPPGRTPVETRVISDERLAEVIDGLGRHLGGGRPGLLGLPAGRGERDDRRRRRRGARRGPAPALRRRQVGLVHGRMKGPEKDAVMASFAAGELGGAGRDDGDRGRRRRAQCDADDRRGRRALRPRPAPPAARPGRARRRARASACCCAASAERDGAGAPGLDARDQRRLPHRRGGSAPARPGRDPRHAPVGRAGVPRRHARGGRRAGADRARATRACCSTATAASTARAARRRGSVSICSSAMRRWGCSGAASGRAARASSCQAELHRLVGGRDDGLRIAAPPSPFSRTAPSPILRRASPFEAAKPSPVSACDDRRSSPSATCSVGRSLAGAAFLEGRARGVRGRLAPRPRRGASRSLSSPARSWRR